MPANYVLIEKISVGATAISTVTFSSIPQTGYTDLVVKMSTRRDSGANDGIGIRFNGSSAGNYSMRYVAGDGATTSSSSASAVSAIYGYGTNNWATATASTFSNAEFYIPNYTSSNAKSISLDGVIENNAASSFMALTAGLWSLTSAITSIDILPLSGGSFVQYSTFYLYGVAKLGTTPAIVPYATGGDTIMTDGTYWYHTFVSSGTFTPTKAITCDYLVVAGGGGGTGSGAGDGAGGGGGAGGLRSTVTATGGGGSLESALSLASGTGYTVTIGAGGAGGATGSGANGVSSVFSTVSTVGGGRSNLGASGSSGGSGGGGYGFPTGTRFGGAGTANEGFAGGEGTTDSSSWTAGGGGGGAGVIGGTGSGGTGGNGGNGVATSISGSSITYAGGGGGATNRGGYASGTGGTGGGGNGVNASNDGVAGTANRGGGGGGGRNGGNGGSGLVIVRYAV
jgi:hypothetical protein